MAFQNCKATNSAFKESVLGSQRLPRHQKHLQTRLQNSMAAMETGTRNRPQRATKDPHQENLESPTRGASCIGGERQGREPEDEASPIGVPMLRTQKVEQLEAVLVNKSKSRQRQRDLRPTVMKAAKEDLPFDKAHLATLELMREQKRPGFAAEQLVVSAGLKEVDMRPAITSVHHDHHTTFY